MFTTITPSRQFLARVVAWPQDGDQVAYVNIHNTFVPKDKTTIRKDPNGVERLPWTGRATRSVAEAERAVNFAVQSDDARNVYFCTSTQRFAEEKVSGKGFKYLKPMRSSENAVMMKAIFLDCDLVDGKADKSKGYDTVLEWAAAFKEFVKFTGMPRPTIIVNTGGGFHIYWTLSRALTIPEWMPLAYALAEATKRFGLRCDTQCTIDAARVLRVPGTKNFKYDPPRPVSMLADPLDFDYSVERLKQALSSFEVAVPYSTLNQNMALFPPRQPLAGVSDLSEGIDLAGAAPVNLNSLLGECAFLNEAVTTGGNSFSNPLWNLTTLIATFTEGGRGDAHIMAQGHPNYGPGETDDLYDRKMAEKLRGDLGWPKCATISASGCKSCAGCPHFVDNKSPLNFAPRANLMTNHVANQGGFSAAAQGALSGMSIGVNPVAQPTQPAPGQLATLLPGQAQQDPDLPANYLRTPTGLILYPEHDDTNNTITWLPLTHYPMVNPWVQRNPWALNFTTETEHGKTTQVNLLLEDIASTEMRKSLQKQGFMLPINGRSATMILEFFMAWITKLQQQKNAVVNSVPFGWLMSGGSAKGFVYGGKLHTPTGTEAAASTDPELAVQFAPTGDRLPWITAAQMITDQGRPALDAIIASSFAAPLVKWTGHAGLLLSAYSVESGIGKSTALKIAQAVWGDPVKAIQSLSDTQNSVLNKLGELRNLPMYWDELKSEEDTKRFVDTVFRLSLGKEKSRMTAKVQQRSTGTWQTIMVAASNESLLDSVAYKTRATTAGLYRIFEFTVDPARKGGAGQIDPTVAQRIVAKLNDNHGTIGFEYASYLGGNHAQVESDMGKMLTIVGNETKMNPDERFWIALIASLLLGAYYSNALGYTAINEPRLKEFLYGQLSEMRQERNAQPVDMRNGVNVINVLGRFLNENRARHTIMTNLVWRGRGKPPVGQIQVIGDASRLDTIKVHVGQDDKLIRIGQSYLYDWLMDNHYPRHVFTKALKDELGAVAVNGRLGAGTTYANAAEHLIEINLAGNPLANFIDEA